MYLYNKGNYRYFPIQKVYLFAFDWLFISFVFLFRGVLKFISTLLVHKFVKEKPNKGNYLVYGIRRVTFLIKMLIKSWELLPNEPFIPLR